MVLAITQQNIYIVVSDYFDPLKTEETITNYGHISTWDTSGVNNMSSLFLNRTTFNENISAWDVKNVTNMDGMFNGTRSFDQDISGWNTSNVTSMNAIFAFAYSFNQNIGTWNVQKVTSMASMFQAATAFNQDLSLWEPILIRSQPLDFGDFSDNRYYPHWGHYRLNISGNRYMTLLQHLVYTDAGITDTFSSPVTTTSIVNTEIPGVYTVEYFASIALTGKSAPSYAVRYVKVELCRKIDFVLTALESQNVSTKSTLLSQYFQSSSTFDAIVNLETTIEASVLQNTFFYRKDATMVHPKYYVDTSKWNNFQHVLNPKNGIVGEGSYVPLVDGMGKDFMRYLSSQLFDTHLDTNLFTNEPAIISEINNNCDNVATTLSTLFSKVDHNNNSGQSNSEMQTDEFNKKYLEESVTSTSNLSREILNQLKNKSPERLPYITTNFKYSSTDDGFYKIPFMKQDTCSFHVMVKSSDTELKMSGAKVRPRIYKVVLTIT